MKGKITKIARLRAEAPAVLKLIARTTFESARKELKVGRGTLHDLIHENLAEYEHALKEEGKEMKARPRMLGDEVAGTMSSSTGERGNEGSIKRAVDSISELTAQSTVSLEGEVDKESRHSSALVTSGDSASKQTFAQVLKNLPYPFHEAAALYPLVEDDQFKELLESIKTNGLLTEIVLYKDKIIDGRRRIVACLMLGTQLRYKGVTGSLDPYGYVIAAHQHRRNLGKSSLACCAVLALPHYEAAARERQRASLKKGEETPVGLNVSQRAMAGRSAQFAAEQFRVSRAMVNVAKRLHKDNRKWFDKVHAGEISLNAAMQKLRKKNAEQTSADEEVSVQSPIQRVLAHLRSRREDSTKSLKASQTLIDEIEEILSSEEHKL